MESHSVVLTERFAKKIVDMEIEGLTKGMLKVLEVTNQDLCNQMFLEICANGWEFPIARIYCADKETYGRITDGSPGFYYSPINRKWRHRYYDNTFGVFLDRQQRSGEGFAFGDLSFVNHFTEVQRVLYEDGYDINYFDDNGFGNLLPHVDKITQEMFRK